MKRTVEVRSRFNTIIFSVIVVEWAIKSIDLKQATGWIVFDVVFHGMAALIICRSVIRDRWPFKGDPA